METWTRVGGENSPRRHHFNGSQDPGRRRIPHRWFSEFSPARVQALVKTERRGRVGKLSLLTCRLTPRWSGRLKDKVQVHATTNLLLALRNRSANAHRGGVG